MDKIITFLSVWLSKSGDHTFWSWVITFMYILVIIMSIYYTGKIRGEKEKHFFWVCISVFILAMGINKQLDFQILLTMIGKSIAWDLNILDFSRLIWKTLAVGIFVSVVISGIFILYKSRKILRSEKLSLGGVTIMLLFTLIRVGSISHIRLAMFVQYYLISKIHAVELLGLLLICLSLIIKLINYKAKPQELMPS